MKKRKPFFRKDFPQKKTQKNHLNSLTSRIKLTKKQLTKEGRDGKIYNRDAKKARNEKKQFIEKWIEEEEKDQKEEERN